MFQLVLEALQRLRWAAFERKMENSTHYNELLKNIAAVRTSFNRKNIKTLLGSTQLAGLSGHILSLIISNCFYNQPIKTESMHY